MRQVRQSQFFRIFQQKVPSVFSNISLGQFGPKTGSGRIALWALLHRRKLLKIEHFCFFALQKRPSFRSLSVPSDLAQTFGAICAHYRHRVIHRAITIMRA